MKKINSIRHDKIWGYEIWLYSPVAGKETFYEDGTKCQGGPLVKIIKATQPLSVQVHPDDQWAKILENQINGKSESWYILESEPEASLVLGLKSYSEKAIRDAIDQKSFKDMLLEVKVKPGDFYDIPAGLVHGIGAGITLLEVQQPSDVTYRYYDYDRFENGKPRELHIDKAIKVQKDISYELEPTSTNPLTYKNITGKQIVMNTSLILGFDALVVNLDNYETFFASRGEEILFDNYYIIEFI